VRFGGTVALDGVNLEIRPGRVVGVIGPNGAGKTTLVNVLSGFTRSTSGEVEFDGRDIGTLRPARRARLGLLRTFQQLELFDDLTVRENILAGLDDHSFAPYVTDLVRPGRHALGPVGDAVVRALELDGDLDEKVADLPQGKRRLVAIARVVARGPRVICLDEPAAGLSQPERRRLSSVIRSLADVLGAGVLLIEHNVDVVAEVCDELVVLDFGRVIASGETAEVLHSDIVAASYLGEAQSPPVDVALTKEAVGQ
jgi:sulfate-transporting ATPase